MSLMALPKSVYRRARAGVHRVLNPLIRAKPTFLILGAQKSATSSMHFYLSEHPDIFGSAVKEIHYFDLKYEESAGFYLRFFPLRWKGYRHVFESTPGYLRHPECAARIASFFDGGIKLIAILRDPSERMYSHWRMNVEITRKGSNYIQRFEERRPFPQVVDDELDRVTRGGESRYWYIEHGLYHRNIERYLVHFSGDSLLALGFEEVDRHLEYTLSRICRFLDVADFDEEVLRRFAATRVNYDGSPLHATPDRIVGRNVERDAADIQEALSKLAAYYQPENEALFSLMGKRYW